MQDHCDWCYLPLTDEDRRASTSSGLAREDAWSCASCVRHGRVRTPPASWQGNAAEWPFQSDASARLQPYLRPDEEVLWSGGPDPKAWFTRMDLLAIPASIVVCGFWVFIEVLALRNHDLEQALFLVLPDLAVLYVLFGRFFYKRYRKTRTAYGITPQRALIVVGANVRIRSPLRGQHTWVRRSWNGRHASVEIGGPAGVATEAFSANTGLDSYHFQSSDRRRAEVPFAFYDVEQPDAMLNALERAGAIPGAP